LFSLLYYTTFKKGGAKVIQVPTLKGGAKVIQVPTLKGGAKVIQVPTLKKVVPKLFKFRL
jgi:hypothetical protein